MPRLLSLALVLLFASGCDLAGLSSDPTFSFTLQEGVESTMEGDGFAELSCGFAGCRERFVFEDGSEAVYVLTESPLLSAVDRTITVGRSNGTSATVDVNGFGRSLDVDGTITIVCAGERVRGSLAFVASFNERPGEPIEVRGTFDMPRTAASSWNEDEIPPCQ